MSNKCYVINSLAVFYPSERAIVSILNGNRIKLNAPTSQLLEAFIGNIGSTITQSELYSAAWGNNGGNVTPNTLYQNISLLRKALQDSGIKGEYLTTVRGQGFLFNVSSILEQNVTDISLERNDIDEPCSEPTNKSDIITTTKTVVKRKNYKFISLASLLLFSLVLFDKKNAYENTDDNIYLSSVNTCNVFTERQNHELLEENKVNKFLEDKLLDCQNYPYAYMHYSDIHSTVSLTSCNLDINSHGKNKCKTEIFYNYESLL
ncbi:winged helix-turn-helix domain-containing protein [Yersinia enterocolitica]|uniref:winged helix-turn-helix domain-containing protein n=1 Tax=Yersinia enterocolitica TaxID=630 RepID=UPI003D0155ED